MSHYLIEAFEDWKKLPPAECVAERVRKQLSQSGNWGDLLDFLTDQELSFLDWYVRQEMSAAAKSWDGNPYRDDAVVAVDSCGIVCDYLEAVGDRVETEMA